MRISQRILRFILEAFGLVYISIEKFVEYPDDGEILGVNIDDDLHKMSRKQLCRYMDAVLPKRGFFGLQSTTKIRLGCQLLRNFHLVKKQLKESNGSYEWNSSGVSMKAPRTTAGAENEGWI